MFRLSVIVLAYLVNISLSCPMAKNWQPSNLKEQAAFAGAIIEATIKRTANSKGNSIDVEKAIYHKGCGPTEITIKGFTDNLRCGLSGPSLGIRALFFVCMGNNANEWVLNTYTGFTGSLNAMEANMVELKKMTADEYKCRGGPFIYKDCRTRRDPIVNIFFDSASNRPYMTFRQNLKKDLNANPDSKVIAPLTQLPVNQSNQFAEPQIPQSASIPVTPGPEVPVNQTNIMTPPQLPVNKINQVTLTQPPVSPTNQATAPKSAPESINNIQNLNVLSSSNTDSKMYQQLRDTYARYYQSQYPSYYFTSSPTISNGSTSY